METDESDQASPSEQSVKWTQNLFKLLTATTKKCNDLPSGIEYKVAANDEETKAKLDAISAKAGNILQKLQIYVGASSDMVDETLFDVAESTCDRCFEEVNLCLDRLDGIERSAQVLPEDHSPVKKSRKRRKDSSKIGFDVDNSSKTPWVPRLDKNPHGKVPQIAGNEGGIPFYRHPYSDELESLEYRPDQLAYGKEILYAPMNQSSHVWVDEPSQVSALVEELLQETAIAVDLEHHSHRSFLGFTCLLQIGTRSQDFLIDTIELRNHLQPLNKVFANPAIVKVLHGAKMDIMWLQRDLGLYIVNLFDTHEAAIALDFSRRRLVDLLQFYCQQKVDKTYQLADWSLRPLPPGMLEYARSDVHFLLYVYDRLRNTIVEKGKHIIQSVLGKSKALCLRTYRKPLFSSERFLKRAPPLTETQRRIFALLCRLRDEVARKLDEGVGYLEPLKNIIQICTHCGSFEDFKNHIPRESRIFSKHAKTIFGMITTLQNSGHANIETTVQAIFASSDKIEDAMEIEESAGTTGPGLLKNTQIKLPEIEVVSSESRASSFVNPIMSPRCVYKHSARVPDILRSLASQFERDLSGLIQKSGAPPQFMKSKLAPSSRKRPTQPQSLRKRRRDDEDPSRKKQRMSVPDLNKKAFNYGEAKFGDKKTKRKDNFKF